MDTLQTILLALIGNVALLAVLGWLAKSVMTQFLSRDIEKFKSTLSETSAITTERFKHDLQVTAIEHQVRFAKLYERRAEVIAELYGFLVEAHWASQSFVSLMDLAGDPSKEEKYATAMNKAAEFYRYFDKNRIYLPQATCDQLEQFVRNMRHQIIGFGVYASKEDSHLPAHAVEKKYNAWMKAAEYFDTEVPKARATLEAELRSILGA